VVSRDLKAAQACGAEQLICSVIEMINIDLSIKRSLGEAVE